jgi:spore coat-associated protein N
VSGTLSLQAKLAVTAVAVSGTAAVAGLGTFGTFTDTTSASAGVTSGTVDIELGATNTSANRLSVGASGLVPTDSIQRAVTLTNAGDQALSALTLTTAATVSSLLSTDATNGLQMLVQRCSVAWTETGSSAPFTYSCSGTTTSVIASRPVVGSGLALTSSPALSPAGVDYLRVTLTLPSTAGNSFQGLTSTVSFTFDATQRTLTDK